VRKCAASGARVMVTGCGVDLEAQAFEVDGVESLFKNEQKSELPGAACDSTALAPGIPWTPVDLSRVPVKVQEGCKRFCTYCIVPYLRPKHHSRAVTDVVRQVRSLAGLAVGEVILCGIDLGSYRDPETTSGLSGLARAVAEAAPEAWVRLSSIELFDVDEGLLELMREGVVCRHLHVPLQSGDAHVLKAMGRDYDPGRFEERVREIADAVPGVSITSDVMAGFPGEDRKAFENTFGLVERIGFGRLHVFKYSRRPGTRAYSLGDPVEPGEKHARALELRSLGSRLASHFHAGLVGRIIPVLVEDVMKDEPGMVFGRAESFAGAVFEGRRDLVGRRVMLEVTGSDSSCLRGVVAGPDERRMEGEPCGR